MRKRIHRFTVQNDMAATRAENPSPLKQKLDVDQTKKALELELEGADGGLHGNERHQACQHYEGCHWSKGYLADIPTISCCRVINNTPMKLH